MEENKSITLESVYKAEETECRSLVIKAKKGEATSQQEHLEDIQSGKCYVEHSTLNVSSTAFIS